MVEFDRISDHVRELRRLYESLTFQSSRDELLARLKLTVEHVEKDIEQRNASEQETLFDMLKG